MSSNLLKGIGVKANVAPPPPKTVPERLAEAAEARKKMSQTNDDSEASSGDIRATSQSTSYQSRASKVPRDRDAESLMKRIDRVKVWNDNKIRCIKLDTMLTVCYNACLEYMNNLDSKQVVMVCKDKKISVDVLLGSYEGIMKECSSLDNKVQDMVKLIDEQDEKIAGLEGNVSTLEGKVRSLEEVNNKTLIQAKIGDYFGFYLKMVKREYSKVEAKKGKHAVWSNFETDLEYERVTVGVSDVVLLYSQPHHAILLPYVRMCGFTAQQYEQMRTAYDERNASFHSGFNDMSASEQQQQLTDLLAGFAPGNRENLPSSILSIETIVKKVVGKMISDGVTSLQL